jgi:nucleoside-diphosphate-sugar epimerase
MRKRISITGGAGFLGKHLVELLAKNDDYDIILLARNKQKYLNIFKDMKNITIHHGDLLRPNSLENFIIDNTTIIHLAYISESPEDNIIATNNIITQANKVDIKQFIHCSTAVVCGFNSNKLINENSPLEPKGSYQKNKADIEKVLSQNLLENTSLIILRPTEIFGNNNKSIINKIIFRHRTPSMKSYIYNFILFHRRFNLVSVHNVTHAIEFLINFKNKSNRDIFIISDDDDEDNSYKNVSSIISNILSPNNLIQQPKFGLPILLLNIIFTFLKTHSPPNRLYSNNKIFNIGYKRKVSIADGIKEIILDAC